MKPSLSYYLTLFVIKLKGIKKTFQKDPIDYQKLRKEDVLTPKGSFFKHNNVQRFTIKKTTVTEIPSSQGSKKLIIFIHGGAFVSGPAIHHWDTIKTIFKKTNHTIWMCDYPKAPEHTISIISSNIDAVYHKALGTYPADAITIIGDSVGGTLTASLVQRLIKHKSEVPAKIILISPVMHAAMTNPAIAQLDNIDPMLSTAGVRSAKKLCAENGNLEDEKISPLNGSFKNFPKTILCVAEHDITYPDQQLTIQKLEQANVDLKVIVGKKMPHIWPLLPVMKEAKTALELIIKSI